MVRGAYGTTVAAHLSGAPFARLDGAIFKYVYDQTRIGKTVYFKFQSFNVYGGGVEDLATLPSYPYAITGAALSEPLDNPTNISVSYFGDIAQINFDTISDIRSPIFYELRKGSAFDSGNLVSRTPQSYFRVSGSGTYWVAAMYITPLGTYVYSATPVSITVTTATLTQNVLGIYSEEPTWTGTKTNCSVSGSNLISTFGQSSATYQIPSAHRVFSSYVCNARVTINLAAAGVSAASDITAISDVVTTPDITFGGGQGKVFAVPQINLSQDGGSTWAGWQNWVPGVYKFNAIDFRVVMSIADTTYQCVLSNFDFEVDVDDLTQAATVTTSSSGPITVTFASEFNIPPDVTLTVENKQAGDTEVYTSVTTSDLSLEVLNSGVAVVRAVTYNAKGA